MASVRPGLSRGGSIAFGFDSSSVRRLDREGSRKELLSGTGSKRGGFQEIQEGLENVPLEDESFTMPRTKREMSAREQQRVNDYEERKAWRSERLKSITNQWADNRVQNSSLQKPRRTSWIRSDENIETRRCDYLFCCFG